MKLEFPNADPRLASLPFATEVLNRFFWNVSVEHEDGEFRLRSGEILIARFSSIEELEVFAAGMAFAFWALPPSVVQVIDRELGAE